LWNLWTNASTASEGNTLTLGEIAFALQEWLTVSGKPLKDHEGVFRIIQPIPSLKAETFKRWLDKVGYERVKEDELDNNQVCVKFAHTATDSL